MEERLADPAPNKPFALTLGAAAVTLAVIVGVLTGPSIVSCFNADQGMGVCLRDQMTNAGLFPRQAVAEAPAAAVPEDVAVVTPADEANPERETAIGEGALDVTPPDAESAQQGDALVAATFGLLRAEPDGSVVIAGSGTPGSEVEVYSDDELIGSAEVESSGDWVVVPETPIAPGGTEITLAETGKAGRAEQSFVVVINDDRTSEPLVVASTPGAASEVLQGLDRPADATPTQMAAADPVSTPPAAPAPPPANDTGEAVPTPDAAEPVATEPPATPAEDTPEAPTAPAAQASVDTAPTVEQPAESAPEQASPPEAPAAEAPSTDTPAPAEPATATQPTPALPATEPAPAIASADPLPATPPAPLPAAPTIDAIEIEGDRTFFAGAGMEGATIRLYVDDSFIADAEVTDGRWLVEAGNVLTRPSQRVRIDMLQAGTAEVAARAEVNFLVDMPPTAPPTAVAQADIADAADQPAPQPAPEAAPAIPDAAEAPAVATPAAEAGPPPAASPQDASPQEPSTAAMPPATQPAPVAEPPAATPSMSEPVAEPPASPPSMSEPAASSPPPETPATEPTEAQADIPTLVAISVGGPDSERFAAGKAIIRRGDNLWTIARRVYGEGIRYTTIYDANTAQIRDPDRIYPGQVFDLPN